MINIATRIGSRYSDITVFGNKLSTLGITGKILMQILPLMLAHLDELNHS